MRWKGLIITLSILISGSVVFGQTFGVKKRMPRPHEFGDVLINNYSANNKIAPVVFNHWLHRAKYTCRLCHIDIGFAMVAGGTYIREDDNKNGLYCGSCHNGKESFSSEETDPDGNVRKNCDRCHSYRKKIKFKNNFYKFVKGFPRSRFGNKVDWLKAEEEEMVELKDYLEGISIKRKPLEIPVEMDLRAKEMGMPDIIFSHEKHSVWSGCELCHPEIFGVKKGATKYTMQEIFEGKFCGACHGKVAFPNLDCRLCHAKDVY
jgi:c(7)-type cytochrome triheme protein